MRSGCEQVRWDVTQKERRTWEENKGEELWEEEETWRSLVAQRIP